MKITVKNSLGIELPDNIALKALNNYKREVLNEGRDEYQEEEYQLISMFTWSNSSEKHDYWNKIDKKKSFETNTTINQYLDMLLSTYGGYNKMNEELKLLHHKLSIAKNIYGGNQIITPEKECKELINKYL